MPPIETVSEKSWKTISSCAEMFCCESQLRFWKCNIARLLASSTPEQFVSILSYRIFGWRQVVSAVAGGFRACLESAAIRLICATRLRRRVFNSPLPCVSAIGRTGSPLESRSRPQNHRHFLLVIYVRIRCCSIDYPAWQMTRPHKPSALSVPHTHFKSTRKSSFNFLFIVVTSSMEILFLYDNFTNKNIHKSDSSFTVFPFHSPNR